MLLMTLIIVAVVLFGFILMTTEQAHHINRATIAMVSGVAAWVIYMVNGGQFVQLMHQSDYASFMSSGMSSSDSIKYFISEHVITRYIIEACSVILFLIATNTIVEVLHNNGVFDSLMSWLRMRGSRKFLWTISILTFVISANVDNLTTVVLMMSFVANIVRNHYQRVIYASAIIVSACMGGCFTAIGDMTSVMLWVRGLITPSAYAAGLFLPAIAVLCTFNLLIGSMLHGRVEIYSVLTRYDGNDSSWAAWQKVVLLVLGIAGLWFIPSFLSSAITSATRSSSAYASFSTFLASLLAWVLLPNVVRSTLWDDGWRVILIMYIYMEWRWVSSRPFWTMSPS